MSESGGSMHNLISFLTTTIFVSLCIHFEISLIHICVLTVAKILSAIFYTVAILRGSK